MLKNTLDSYGSITKLFHWFIGVIIITMIIVGFTMVKLEPTPQKWQIYALHKATGTVVLTLVLLKFIWSLLNRAVSLPNDLPTWQKVAAKININLLYMLMFLMPLSGFWMTILAGYSINFYGLFIIESFTKNIPLAEVLSKVHTCSAFTLTALITLHILAAIYHHCIRKDNILKRMWIS